MPHRVSNFFRHPSNTLDTQVSNLKKATTNNPLRRNGSGVSPRSSSSGERVFSYASSLEDDNSDSDNHSSRQITPTTTAARMSDSPRNPPVDRPAVQDKKDSHSHRLSFPGLHLGRSHSKERQQREQRDKEHHGEKGPVSNGHVSVDWKVESPPIVFLGDAENSSGALVSGQMFLDVRDDLPYEVESFGAVLRIHVIQKRPFTLHCQECTNQYTEVQQWDLLKQPLSMSKGLHQFPFSVLLGGHLPASVDGPLFSITYEFKAELAPRRGTPLKFERIFDVKRAQSVPDLPHRSVRVFPPTNIKASVHFPQVIYPVGANPLTLRLDGLAKLNDKPGTIEYWRLKKLTWRLEETAKAVAPSCEKHRPKDEHQPEGEVQQPQKKGAQRLDSRVVGEKTLFNGWKSDYTSANEGNVELDLEYALSKQAQAHAASGPGYAGKYSACDLRSRDGLEISHQLMIEMVVSQEWAPVGKPSLITQTGVGRILRMHFATILTERGGIGISWDNEAPPIYQDVPPSPPGYDREDIEETDGVDPAGASSSSSINSSNPAVFYESPLDGSRMGGIDTPPYVESPRLLPQA